MYIFSASDFAFTKMSNFFGDSTFICRELYLERGQLGQLLLRTGTRICYDEKAGRDHHHTGIHRAEQEEDKVLKI